MDSGFTSQPVNLSYRIPSSITITCSIPFFQLVFHDSLSSPQSAGELDKVRRTQRKGWMWSHVDHQLVARFRDWPGMAALAASVEEKVEEGAMAPGTATDLLLDHFFDSTHKQ